MSLTDPQALEVERMVHRKLAGLRMAPRIVDIAITIGSQGVPVAPGDHQFLRLGLNGALTVLNWSLGATVAGVAHTGACRVDVQVGTTLAGVASICGGTGNQPQLSAQSERADQAPTGWTTQIADARWLVATVVTADGTLEVLGLTLRCSIDGR